MSGLETRIEPTFGLQLKQENNRRILIVDDNQDIHRDFHRILVPEKKNTELEELESMLFDTAQEDDQFQQEAYELDSAYQGKEGLHKIYQAIEEKRPYALAFVDMRMPPGWDGLTTIKKLWKIDSHLQIVICTAYTDHSWNNICASLQRTEQFLIIKKPFDPVEILQASSALVAKWNIASTLRLSNKARKDAEAMVLQSDKLASLGKMAAGIGHEINNPLNNILSLSKLMQRNLDMQQFSVTELQEDVTSLQEEALRASGIVRGILNFARELPESEVSDVNIVHWIKSSVQLVKQEFKSRLINLHYNVRLDDDLVIQGHAGKLQQALINLLLNAVYASAEGSNIEIFAEQDTNWVYIRIIDYGTGLDEAIAHRIFDPFFTTRDIGEGTGLGLSIALGIVMHHHGDLVLENHERGGVRATIMLPLDGD